jgi:hypothetical protein
VLQPDEFTRPWWTITANLTGPEEVTFGPGTGGDLMIVTHVDAAFAGDGGGGHLELGDFDAGVTFWSTDPAGGARQWDHWDGFQVIIPGHRFYLNCFAGNFGIRVSTWLTPAGHT